MFESCWKNQSGRKAERPEDKKVKQGGMIMDNKEKGIKKKDISGNEGKRHFLFHPRAWQGSRSQPAPYAPVACQPASEENSQKHTALPKEKKN